MLLKPVFFVTAAWWCYGGSYGKLGTGSFLGNRLNGLVIVIVRTAVLDPALFFRLKSIFLAVMSDSWCECFIFDLAFFTWRSTSIDSKMTNTHGLEDLVKVKTWSYGLPAEEKKWWFVSRHLQNFILAAHLWDLNLLYSRSSCLLFFEFDHHFLVEFMNWQEGIIICRSNLLFVRFISLGLQGLKGRCLDRRIDRVIDPLLFDAR